MYLIILFVFGRTRICKGSQETGRDTMGISDSCMREDDEDLEKRRTLGSFDLKKRAKENEGRHSLPVKEIERNKKPSSPKVTRYIQICTPAQRILGPWMRP